MNTPTSASVLAARSNLSRRRRQEAVFRVLCLLATCIGVAMLVLLLYGIFRDGLPRLNWRFLESFPSRFPERAGVKAALVGTLWIMGITALVAIPVGVAAAIYLEEFAPKNRLTALIQTNIANLAGVPSIVYALLGLAVFVRALSLGRSVLAGALTISLLILPTVIITTQEALRAVPRSLRDGSLALGATPWQTVRHMLLPTAFPGILTGIILSLSRAMGESAPLVTIGALAYIAYLPKGPLDGFTALPIQIFNWAARPQAGFHHAAAAASIVLLVALLLMNSVAIVLRNRYRKQVRH
jgi:phosphate transport system permease protein